MGGLVLDNIVFGLQRAGGVSVMWVELARRLLAGGEWDVLMLERPAPDNIFGHGLDVPPRARIGDMRVPAALRRWLNPRLRGLGAEPFLFHSSYYRICSNPAAVNITTVHDFTYERLMHGVRALVHSRQKFNAIRRAKEVICVSESTRRDLLEYLPDVDPGRVHVIYHGVGHEYRQLESVPSDLPFGGGYLLYVGSRAPYKNFVFCVESIADTAHRLVIAGTALTAAERRLLDKRLGRERYHVSENAPNQELNRLYNGAKALLYPSSYEGFGIPVVEAQAAGCPVIALRASSIPEVVGTTPLLIDNLDSASLQRRLQILDSESARAEIIAAGLENSRRFSWDDAYKRTSAVYRRAIAGC